MSNHEALRNAVGVVVIGRNEGERLIHCLDSIAHIVACAVYVDSGSIDGSSVTARARGFAVVELDGRAPFTAARARNEGFKCVRELVPDLRYVQFLDGDCELTAGWLDRAAAFLREREDVAAVSGSLREKYPTRTIYNMLCDIEWDAAIGEAKACGGNALMRVAAFESVRGFRADLIAGEEAELCVRLRASAWRIWHLGEEMARHDAAISRFSQWWKRALRTGYAFAQGASSSERHWVRECRSAWVWGLGLPLLAIAGTALIGPASLLILLMYPLQVVRLALSGKRGVRENWWRALFLVVGKFAELAGQLKFFKHRWFRGKSALIEYK